MPDDTERLRQARAALDRAMIANPKLFAVIQARILAEDTGFLDWLALHALADEETGRATIAQIAGQRYAAFHAEGAKHHHHGARHA